ncbi:hypothetical protein E4U42_007827, partial [Claviceps africana]
MRAANLARHGRRLLVCHRATAAPACLSYATTARRRPMTRPVVRRAFARTFLNTLFQKPPREIRQPEYEPGWMQIMVWRSRMLDNLRSPPRKDLKVAWRQLMASKLERRRPLNSTQALQCRRLLEFLSSGPCHDQHDERPQPTAPNPFPAPFLSMARKVLLDIKPRERTKHHLDLARALYAAWAPGITAGPGRGRDWQWRGLVKMMCEYGAAEEAMRMLQSKWRSPECFPHLAEQDCLLEAVARGLAREGKEAELVALVAYAREHGVPYNAAIQSVTVEYFASRDRVAETKHWLAEPNGQRNAQARVYRLVASFARRNGLEEWAAILFRDLGQSKPFFPHWNVILQSILLLGKSLAEVDALMSHMVGRNGLISPTVSTINGLLTVAVEMKDAALAEGIMTLAANREIALNGETFLFLLQLRLETGDVEGARQAFDNVRHFEPWNNESGTDIFGDFCRATNAFLALLSRQLPPDFPLILRVLKAVEEDQMLLEPHSVATLCLRFLENGQNFDVVDLLSIHCFQFSEQQREVVQDAFVAYCLDRGTSTSRAWDAYQILQQFFQDTSFERRMTLMQTFFDRKRSDMASHVFGHMRQHRNRSYHPTMDTYVQYLEGVARHPDPEGLAMVHNMLKTDTTMQPNTKLYTGLMLAYTACGKPAIALDFWHDITSSAEGPSYASLEAVFWTLERKPGGERQAREIWEKIERMDLEVPATVYNAY